MPDSTIQNARSVVEALNAPGSAPRANAFAELGQQDFLKLLTVQLQQQDPFEPVDNKDMLAQMAQFSALAGNATANEELANIAAKLDALIDAQRAARAAAEAALANSMQGAAPVPAETPTSTQGA